MKNSFEYLLGWRYTRASRGAQKKSIISFVSLLSMIGTIIGVAALIIVISVMNGFQKEIRERMLSIVPNVQVYPAGVQDTSKVPEIERTLATNLKKNPEVEGISAYMSSESIVLQDGELLGVKVEGIDPETEGRVSELPKKMIAGSISDLKEGEFNVVIGMELANKLGLQISENKYALGESITLMAPESNMTVAGMIPRMRQFKVVGVFSTGHFELDNLYTYINVADATKLFHDGRPGLRVKLHDLNKAQEVNIWIQEHAGMPVMTRDWTELNPGWFSAVKTEKVMISIILMLIVAVAGFNLISMLMMTVTEKQSDIAILRTLGASRRSIMKIFMIQGALIGGLGTILGVFFGVLVAVNVGAIVKGIEHLFHTDLLPKGVYMIGTMPSEVRFNEVALIAFMSFAMSLLATIYPSQKAAAVEPAKALRYE